MTLQVATQSPRYFVNLLKTSTLSVEIINLHFKANEAHYTIRVRDAQGKILALKQTMHLDDDDNDHLDQLKVVEIQQKEINAGQSNESPQSINSVPEIIEVKTKHSNKADESVSLKSNSVPECNKAPIGAPPVSAKIRINGSKYELKKKPFKHLKQLLLLARMKSNKKVINKSIIQNFTGAKMKNVLLSNNSKIRIRGDMTIGEGMTAVNSNDNHNAAATALNASPTNKRIIKRKKKGKCRQVNHFLLSCITQKSAQLEKADEDSEQIELANLSSDNLGEVASALNSSPSSAELLPQVKSRASPTQKSAQLEKEDEDSVKIKLEINNVNSDNHSAADSDLNSSPPSTELRRRHLVNPLSTLKLITKSNQSEKMDEANAEKIQLADMSKVKKEEEIDDQATDKMEMKGTLLDINPIEAQELLQKQKKKSSCLGGIRNRICSFFKRMWHALVHFVDQILSTTKCRQADCSAFNRHLTSPLVAS